MIDNGVKECLIFHFDRFAGRPEFGVAIAAPENLPQPLVKRAITLAALRAANTKPRSPFQCWSWFGYALSSLGRADRFGVTQIVDNHSGRAKDFVAASITALEGLKYNVVGLRRVVAYGDGLVVVWVKPPSEAIFGFDSVAT